MSDLEGSAREVRIEPLEHRTTPRAVVCLSVCPSHSIAGIVSQMALLWQRDRARHLSVEILQLQNVRPLLIIGVERDYLRGAIVWSHL